MSHEPDKPMGKADLPPPRTWRRQAIGWGVATAVFSAVLALVANLSEVAGWLRPDETREIVEETRKTIVGTNAKVDELVILLRNQAAAAGVDLNIASDAAIRNAISAIVASGDAQKQKAVKFINNGDVAGAAELLTKVATEQASAVSQTREAAAESWREAAALYNLQDLTKAVDSYEQGIACNRTIPTPCRNLAWLCFTQACRSVQKNCSCNAWRWTRLPRSARPHTMALDRLRSSVATTRDRKSS
jgi:tetratricopeptide (TPR) repeat protein